MKIDFEKSGGLVPVIVQDASTLKVLMLAYMNEESYNKTKSPGRLHFSAGPGMNYGKRERQAGIGWRLLIYQSIVTEILSCYWLNPKGRFAIQGKIPVLV
jgi:hypothetical protein